MNNNRYRKPEEKKPQLKEEFAIILDIISDNSNSFKSNDIIQAIGTTTYTLLELVAKEGVTLRPGQKVYIGEDKRDEIQYIKRTLTPDKLSGSANSELLFTLIDIVEDKEEYFIKFFNLGGPITIRKHAFELIPRIGKKHLRDLIDERNKRPFKDFKDIEERCPYLSEPSKAIAQRILIEIEGEDDFKFFTRK